jgi:O-methyltransferase involved in polyketide biosynthesis
LYIPLYGKAFVSQKGLILQDPMAEEIWTMEGFPLRGKSKSKWLAYYMAMRSAVFDDWVRQRQAEETGTLVIHIGCGLDSRALRVGGCKWYDVDFPDVIQVRKQYFAETDTYHMIGCDVRDSSWLSALPSKGQAIVVMEGVSMYMTAGELEALLQKLATHFDGMSLLMDCYTSLAAKLSKYKNPVHDLGVTQVYGMDDPAVLCGSGIELVQEHDMTPQRFVDQLQGLEKKIFAKLYAGAFAKKLYRMFEFRKG